MSLGDSLGPDGRRPELYGIGGWLAFLCVTLLVFTPIGFVADIVNVFRAAGMPLYEKALIVGVDIVLGGLAVFSGIALIRSRPNGLRVAKVLFILSLAVWVFIGASVLFFGSATTDAIVQTAGHIILSAAWLTYLYKSERVRNTYARAHAESAAEVFG